MTAHHNKILPMALLLGASLLTLPALAQGTGAGSARTAQQDRAMCAHLQQDPAACAREASAAREAARRGQLTSAPDYSANALARCVAHPPAERAACEARITGAGQTRVEGSVMGGGVIRETVTPITLPAPAAAAPMPAPMPMVSPQRVPQPVMPRPAVR